MRFADIAELGWTNLKQSRLRTLLTTLGVSIGVAALTGMVSLGVGLQDNLNARLLKTGFFQTVAVFPFASGGESTFRRRDPKPLDEMAMTAIRQIPGVRRADPDIRIPLTIELGDKRMNTNAVALAMDAGDEAIFREMPHGKYFSGETAAEVILNTESARELGFEKPADLLGKMVRASVGPRGQGRGAVAPPASSTPGSRPASAAGPGRQPESGPSVRAIPPAAMTGPDFSVFGGPGGGAMPGKLAAELTLELRVVGLVERERAIFGNFGARAYLPFAYAQEKQRRILAAFPMLGMMRGSFGGFTGATVHLESAREIDKVEKAINALGYRTISIASAISQLRRVFLLVDMILAFVGSIGLAVACLGITNTMVMAVLERTREIGVMKAIGAEDGDIRRLFLVESAVIGAVGGVGGLILAWLLGKVINAGANVYFVQQGFQPENLFIIPLWLVATAMAFAIAVAVMSGLYPAARAAAIDPTRALRHD